MYCSLADGLVQKPLMVRGLMRAIVLPPDFAKIPKNSVKANVLSSVPGTTEASDAVLLAQVPQTAIVNKKEAEAKVKVRYDGDPKFVAIDNTSMLYATNTTEKIIPK